VTVVTHSGFAESGAGATDLAKAIVAACDKPNTFSHLTPDGMPLVQQIEAIATKLYGAAAIDLESQARKDLERIEAIATKLYGAAAIDLESQARNEDLDSIAKGADNLAARCGPASPCGPAKNSNRAGATGC
jgi:formyltetrahydrofolate synthetase